MNRTTRQEKGGGMIEYLVVEATSVSGVINRVYELVKEGWKPQGGICVYGSLVYQAMIRESGKK